MVDKYIDLFLDYLRVERGLSDNTLISYANDLKRYSNYLSSLGITSVSDIQKRHITQFMSRIKATGLAVGSMARGLSTIKSFHRFLVREKITDKDCSSTIDTPRLWKKVPQVLSQKEVERLLAQPKINTPRGLS